MLESYLSVPEGCTTMKVVVVPAVQKQEGMKNNILMYQIEFPMEYTQIKHDWVNINFMEK